ncbi:MAG: M48 family metalloprotease [Bryobacteraceae bacterium]|nr:M48 family metalloprotease [Bryobacteraceae bacterium]
MAVALVASVSLYAGDTTPPAKAPETKAPEAKTADGKKKPAKKDPDQIGNRDVGKGMNFYSLEKEIALGKSLANDIERQARIIDDPLIAEYVSRVGQNLVRNSDAKVPFTIKVVDSEDVNAFALPGGFFYVNTGLIMAAESESELAGVMGHEIAHIAARHGTKQATRGTVANLATIPLMFMGWGWTTMAIRQGVSVLIPLAFLQFSQAQERESDVLGLQYMYKAGYDPTSFVDFFEKLQSREKRKPGTMAKIFSSHPPTAERVTDAQKNIGEMLTARPDYIVTTSEFNEVKARLLAINGRRKATPEDPNRPRLKRAPGGSIPSDDGTGKGKAPTDEDDRPTLKKRQ